MGKGFGRLESNWTRVDGQLMHARVSAEPAAEGGPAVVLVHGLIVSSRYFVPLAERLAADYRVYAPDLPGYGKSAKPSQVLNVPELADALAAWMRAVGLDRAVLIGNSFGCQIVVDFGVRYPDRITRAVLLGPTVDPSARSAPRQVARWLWDVPREPRSLGLVIARDLSDMGPRRALSTFRYMLRDRIEEKLPQLRVPALIMRGTRDPTVPQRWAEEAARLLPLGRLVVIPGAAHTLNYNAPLEVARVVHPFLTEPFEPGAWHARTQRSTTGELLSFDIGQ